MKKIIVVLVVVFILFNIAMFGSMEKAVKVEEEKMRITLIAPFANEAYWGSVANGLTKAGKDLDNDRILLSMEK